MKTWIFLFVVGLHGAAAKTHTLRYFYTASSGVTNFPEFVSVGYVDEAQMVHYDSNTRRYEPKQDWMKKVTEDDPQYLDSQAQSALCAQQAFKASIDILKHRFNQTGGVHIVQRMYGCDWDDETNEVNGFDQYGYDGEDFISFDLKMLTWIAPTQQAFTTKHKWDHTRNVIANQKQYYTQICIDWLKKYVSYGRSSLMRTELPSVSLLQKTSSSPVTCFATGFYPDRAALVWRKDGVELHEDVDHGEILPNHDGTFQMSADLKLSSVAPEDWKKYECVFQLSGAEDKVTRLEKSVIQTNEGNALYIYIIVAVAVLALALIGAIGFFLYRQKNAKRPPSPISNREVMEQLNPKEAAQHPEHSLWMFLHWNRK